MRTSKIMGPGTIADPYYVFTGEIYTGKLIVKRILNGRENYMTWKIAMEIALSARSQLNFVRGNYARPTDPAMFVRWQRCNDIVMFWIMSSVIENIGEQIMRAKDVMTAWTILKTRYGGTNLARKSVLLTKIGNCVQGSSTVSPYFDHLCKYWEKVDAMKKLKSCSSTGICTCCLEADDEIQEDRVVKFLIGLNEEFSAVKSNIFAMKQVPKMDIVFDMVKPVL